MIAENFNGTVYENFSKEKINDISKK